MARKKGIDSSVAAAMAAIDNTNQAGVPGLLDDCLSESRRLAQEKQLFDGQVFSADETIAQLICVPMPALAPRFLLQGEGWPLGRFTLIDGFQESCKSAFLNEVGLWHRRQGGHYIVIEAEDKDGSDLRDSFFNYDRKAWSFTRTRTQEQWNRAFFWWVEQIRNSMDGYDRELSEAELAKEEKKRKKEFDDAVKEGKRHGKGPAAVKKKAFVPGKGRSAPVCIGVDSISAVLIERWSSEMLEKGEPDLNHPLGARLLSDFFKVGPKQLTGFPISMMAVSHLREKQDPRTHAKERITTGGAAPKFQMSTEIEMKRRKRDEIVRPHPIHGEIRSIDLAMHVRKNSLAGHEFVNVEMAWYLDQNDRNPLTGEPRQKSFFDWHSASIQLLIDCSKTGDAGKGFYAPRAKAIRELIDLHPDDGQQVWSHALEIGSDSKLSYFEAGRLLENKIQTDREFRARLYELLGIRQRRMFIPGIDLRDQVKAYYNDLTTAETASAGKLAEMASEDVPLPTRASEEPPEASPGGG